MTAGVIHYCDGRLPEHIHSPVRRHIEASGMPIVCVTLKPFRWPAARVVTFSMERGALTMFQQIHHALSLLETDRVFFAEQDVLYPVEHFREAPQEPVLTYNQHVYKLDTSTGRALHYRCSQTSGLSGDRLTLLEHYRARVARVERDGYSTRIGYEPGTHRRPERIDDLVAETWLSSAPLVDLRHGGNLTPSRWSQDQFRTPPPNWVEVTDIPGWGASAALASSLQSAERPV